MGRLQIIIPAEFSFTTLIPVRITDINYGNHLGNDAVLSLLHEARMQFLKSKGYTEMDVEGVSLIMSDVSIQFKAEAFYGDILTVQVATSDFTRAGFTIYYRLIKNETTEVAIARTGMVCYDYGKKKVVSLPEKANLF